MTSSRFSYLVDGLIGDAGRLIGRPWRADVPVLAASGAIPGPGGHLDDGA
jgi:hypothetical protein